MNSNYYVIINQNLNYKIKLKSEQIVANPSATKMNILENIANQSFHNEAFSQLLSSQSHWIAFKVSVQNILDGNISELTKAKETWGKIEKHVPFLIPMLNNYYLYQLDEFINNKFQARISCVSTIDQLFLVMFNVFDINEKFITILNRKDLKKVLQQKLSNVLTVLSIKDKFSQVFIATLRKNCLQIFQEDIIQFEDDVQDHVKTQCSDSEAINKNAIDLKLLKICIQILSQMDILGEYMQKPLQVLNKDFEIFIKSCTRPEQQPFLKKCVNFYKTFYLSFLKKLETTQSKSESSENLNRKLRKIEEQLQDNIYFINAKNCADQILDIVLNFPESLTVIEQLKICADRSNLLWQVSQKLLKGIQKRLLIPGVITQNILNQYINMLNVLQIIDSHGLIFQQITLPIKNYLLRRNDTLRCIISHLTEDGQNYHKYSTKVFRVHSKEFIEDVESDEDQNAAQKWQILQIKQTKTKKRVKYQQIDLVSVLVNLYGSQQAFINEYQSMLAEKLMSAKNYNLNQQIRNIQLLKIRFGQSALQNCHIIMKDVQDSKKSDRQVHAKAKKSNQDLSLDQLNCLAVSKGYWPINYEASTNIYLPENFKSIFDQYSTEYNQIKVTKKILWHYNLGYVDLSLTFNNGSFEFKCQPIHALLITYFDEDKLKGKQSGLSSEDLSNQLNIPHHIIKQKMSFWVHKQVVKQIRMQKGLSLRRLNSMEDGQVIFYKPVEDYYSVNQKALDDDPDTLPAKQSSAMESHLRHIIQGLIISILNINGPKSPQKIHLLLKTVYKTDLDYTYGDAQTLQILKKMTQKKKIFLNGDVYSIKQTSS